MLNTYNFRVWYGEPDIGLLIARPQVQAENFIQATEMACVSLLPLFRELPDDLDLLSMRISKNE